MNKRQRAKRKIERRNDVEQNEEFEDDEAARDSANLGINKSTSLNSLEGVVEEDWIGMPEWSTTVAGE